MMESTIAMSSHREHVHRLPSLNNLLESEVILGDDEGDASSCDGEESEMHSALEELSETNTADLKFHDCSMTSSIADSAILSEPAQPEPDMSRLSLSQSSYKPEETSSMTIRSMLPRSSSTLSNQTTSSSRSSRDQQRLIAPRSKYTDNTNNNKEIVKSVMWLIEAAFLGYVGYMLLAHYRHNYIAVAAGLFALFQTAMIVIVHFVKAHK